MTYLSFLTVQPEAFSGIFPPSACSSIGRGLHSLSGRLSRRFPGALDPCLDLSAEQEYPIVKCADCGMVYSLYRLDPDREQRVYERVIDRDESFRKVMTVERRLADGRVWCGLLQRLHEAGRSDLDLKVVDYGCGWGTLLLTAAGPGVLPRPVRTETAGCLARSRRTVPAPGKCMPDRFLQ